MPIRIRIVKNLLRREKLYRKRRYGLFKKAVELSSLCDAQISIFVVTKTGKCFDYTSSSLSAKDAIERYQRTLGIDLWSEHCEDLKRLKEINTSLRRQICQRTSGDYLDDLSFKELFALELEIEDSVNSLRERKHHKIQTLVDVCTKKVIELKNLQWKIWFVRRRVGNSVNNGKVNEYRDVVEQLKRSNLNDMAQTESSLTSLSNVSAQILDGSNESSPIQNPPDEDKITFDISLEE